MEKYSELETIIAEIENDMHHDHELLNVDIKDSFKELMHECGDRAVMLEVVGNNSIGNAENKEVLQFAVNTISRIYNISESRLVELCEYSFFSKKQIETIVENCKNKNNTSDKCVCLLFESTALELSLIDYPKNKSLFARKKQAEDEISKNENTFDSFIRYLVSEGVPSVILEELARLTVYQKLHFEDNMNVNLKFQRIYNNFVETGKITKTEIEYSKEIIEKTINKNVLEYPVQIVYNDGNIPIAKCVIDNNIVEKLRGKTSPSTHLDAWGVKDNYLHAYCVTNNYNFELQNIQIAKVANAIDNGIITNDLNGINDYKLTGLCRPLIGDLNDDYNTFNSHINTMFSNGLVTKHDLIAFKNTPVNKEILKILDNTSDDLYEKIHDHISLGLHSDNTKAVKLKSMSTQVSTSISNIVTAIRVLKKISDEHKTLHQIDTAFSTYALELCDAYRLSHSALISTKFDYKKSVELKNALKEAKEDLKEIGKSLRFSNSRNATSFVFAVEDEDVIIERKEGYNNLYKEQFESLTSGQPSSYETQKLLTGTHNVDFENQTKKSRQSILSDILNGQYKHGPITQSLLVDALLFKLKEVKQSQQESEKNTMHLGSYKQLMAGIKQGLKKNFDLNVVLDNINVYPELKERIKANKEFLVDVYEIQTVLRIREKDKIREAEKKKSRKP